PRFAMTLR
ncbi:hypothetical protein MKD33_15765, partial [Chromobacterium piscinae]